MAYLVETSLLLRLANAEDPDLPVARRAISELHRQGQSLRSAPQVFVEFRSVATRPKEVNGLGLNPAEAETRADGFEALFPLLPDTPDIYPAWKTLVQTAGVIGKQVHDARLVAVCQVYGISHVLTFNVGHFTRLAAYVSGLTVVDPRTASIP